VIATLALSSRHAHPQIKTLVSIKDRVRGSHGGAVTIKRWCFTTPFSFRLKKSRASSRPDAAGEDDVDVCLRPGNQPLRDIEDANWFAHVEHQNLPGSLMAPA
jgi:hypothetical protein